MKRWPLHKVFAKLLLPMCMEKECEAVFDHLAGLKMSDYSGEEQGIPDIQN